MIIKQARPHVGSTLSGLDVRDALRHEARLLDRFEASGLVPKKILLFEQEANVFLVEELIEGTALRTWVLQRLNRDRGLALADAVAVLEQVVNLLAVVHAEGYVCRDLNSDNIMVDHHSKLRLIDLELLAQPGEQVINAFSVGYAPPEQVAAPELCAAPATTADLFSFGATAFFVVTGVDPVLVADRNIVRPVQDRIATWLELVATDNAAASRLAPLILGLMHDTPNLPMGSGASSGVPRECAARARRAISRRLASPVRFITD